MAYARRGEGQLVPHVRPDGHARVIGYDVEPQIFRMVLDHIAREDGVVQVGRDVGLRGPLVVVGRFLTRLRRRGDKGKRRAVTSELARAPDAAADVEEADLLALELEAVGELSAGDEAVAGFTKPVERLERGEAEAPIEVEGGHDGQRVVRPPLTVGR